MYTEACSALFANYIISINFSSNLFTVTAFGKRCYSPIGYAQYKNMLWLITRKLYGPLQQMFKFNFKIAYSPAAVLIVYTN